MRGCDVENTVVERGDGYRVGVMTWVEAELSNSFSLSVYILRAEGWY